MPLPDPAEVTRLSVRCAVLTLTLGIVLAAGAPLRAQGPISFHDIALESGFQDRLTHGRSLVAADFNLDGWVDFYVGNPSDGLVADDDCFILWSNGPDADGKITFTKGQVLVKGDVAFTASPGDYDNDGDQDLFIGIGGQEGIGLDYLFRNDDGYFTDVSDTARVRGAWAPNHKPVPEATSSGTWVDYDNDGDLDLFTAVRIVPTSLDLPGHLGVRDNLFRNNGDGTFTDVTRDAGVGGVAASMTASWGDFDLDGWMDLFVPHFSPDGFYLYRNNQDGTFSAAPIDPESLDYGSRATWASSVADFNQDGLLDIMAFGRRDPKGGPDSHALLINHGNWTFTNEAVSSGLAGPGIFVPATMGTAVGDWNNDGYPDLFLANGGPLAGERDRLFLNVTPVRGSLAFQDVSPLVQGVAPLDPNCVPPNAPKPGSQPAWVDHWDMLPGSPDDPTSIDTASLPREVIDPCNPPYPYRGHGSIFVDYDKDGDLDLFAVKGGTVIVAPDIWSGEPNRLFRNDGGNALNYLFVHLEGTISNRDAYGARVEVVSSQGGGDPHLQVQQWQGNSGFSVGGPAELHFGLARRDKVDEIRVYWPSGLVSRRVEVGVNQRIRIREDVQLADDFNDGTAAGWTPIFGKWDVIDGTLTQSDPSGVALKAGLDLADFSVAAKLIYVAGEKSLSLLGRASADGRTFYTAQLRDDKAQIFKSMGGVMTPLGKPIAIEPMVPGRSYIVNLTFLGPRISMTVDGRTAALVQDAAIPSGTIGVATRLTRGAFDNVAVR